MWSAGCVVQRVQKGTPVSVALVLSLLSFYKIMLFKIFSAVLVSPRWLLSALAITDHELCRHVEWKESQTVFKWSLWVRLIWQPFIQKAQTGCCNLLLGSLYIYEVNWPPPSIFGLNSTLEACYPAIAWRGHIWTYPVAFVNKLLVTAIWGVSWCQHTIWWLILLLLFPYSESLAWPTSLFLRKSALLFWFNPLHLHSGDSYRGTELGIGDTAVSKTESLHSDWGDKQWKSQQRSKIITGCGNAVKEIKGTMRNTGGGYFRSTSFWTSIWKKV